MKMNETEKVTAYVVRNALTKGIQTVEAELLEPKMIRVGVGFFRAWYYGNDWTLDHAEAVKLATAKLAKAIKSTEAKLERLRKLRFE